jgi:hypothetical protein
MRTGFFSQFDEIVEAASSADARRTAIARNPTGRIISCYSLPSEISSAIVDALFGVVGATAEVALIGATKLLVGSGKLMLQGVSFGIVIGVESAKVAARGASRAVDAGMASLKEASERREELNSYSFSDILEDLLGRQSVISKEDIFTKVDILRFNDACENEVACAVSLAHLKAVQEIFSSEMSTLAALHESVPDNLINVEAVEVRAQMHDLKFQLSSLLRHPVQSASGGNLFVGIGDQEEVQTIKSGLEVLIFCTKVNVEGHLWGFDKLHSDSELAVQLVCNVFLRDLFEKLVGVALDPGYDIQEEFPGKKADS